MWHRSRTATSFAVVFLVLLLAGGLAGEFAARAADWRRDWATLRNERHGFLIAYPIDVFQQVREPNTDEGRVLYSRDGKAQLLVGAFVNDDATTLQAYRDYLMQENYAGARIDYAPVRGKWFDLVPLARPRWEVAHRDAQAVSSARRCNSTFHRRHRLPLEPPPSAVMRSRFALG